MQKWLILALVCFFTKLEAQQLKKLWQSDAVFKVPESVLYDATRKVLYVSNIDGTQPWAKDSVGSIGKLSLDGNPIKVDWITGLHSPKGMALVNNKLYVADVTDLVVIDVVKETIIEKIAIEGTQGLNDVCADKQGNIYVTDSRGKKLYQVTKKGVTVLIENLKGPNGVLIDKKQIFILDSGSLLRFESPTLSTEIASGMEGGTDGIERIDKENWVVSCWQGVIWNINSKGQKKLLLDTRKEQVNSADIGINHQSKIIYVPTFWKNSVIAYQWLEN